MAEMKFDKDKRVSLWPLQLFTSQLKEINIGSEHTKSQLEAIQSTYSCCRRARGDGNSFYRAFLYAFVELNIIKEKSSKEKILSIFAGYKLSEEYQDLQKSCLEKIGEIFSEKSKLLLLQHCLRLFLFSEFSQKLIFLTKLIAAKYILLHPHLKISKNTLEEIALSEGLSLTEYINEKVLKMGKEGSSFIFHILPRIFCVNLTVVGLDLALDSSSILCKQEFPEKEELNSKDSSHLQDRLRIHLLQTPDHFEILLDNSQIEKNMEIIFYDNMIFFPEIKDNVYIKDLISFSTTKCCTLHTNTSIYNLFVEKNKQKCPLCQLYLSDSRKCRENVFDSNIDPTKKGFEKIEKSSLPSEGNTTTSEESKSKSCSICGNIVEGFITCMSCRRAVCYRCCKLLELPSINDFICKKCQKIASDKTQLKPSHTLYYLL